MMNINISDLLDKLTTKKENNNIKNKIVLYLNIKNKTIDILSLNTVTNDYKMFNVPFNHSSLLDDYSEKINSIVSEYIMNEYDIKETYIYVILPNEVISLDHMVIPTLNSKQVKDSLDSMIKTSYKNYKELLIKSELINQNKQRTIYQVKSVKRKIIENVMKGLSLNKINPASISYLGDSYLSGILYLVPKLKDKSFIFFDIKDDITHILVPFKGKTVGVFDLPYGSLVLENNKLNSKKKYLEHPLSKSIISKSIAKAKGSKITENEQEDDISNIFDSSFNTDSNEEIESEEVNTDDVTMSNFKEFIKYAVLISRIYNEKNEGYLVTDLVFNIDSKYSYLFKDLEDKIEEPYSLINFKEGLDKNEEVLSNLELFGATKTNIYNKKIN